MPEEGRLRARLQPAGYGLRRQARLGEVVREELAGHLLGDFPLVVALVNLEVAFQKIDHRQVRARLPIRDRTAVEDEPGSAPLGMDKLPDEPRLANAWLAHHGGDLTAPSTRQREDRVKLVELRVAPDETGESPRGGDLEADPHGLARDQLVDRHRSVETLHRHGPEWSDLHAALSERERAAGEQHRPRVRDLLHAGGQVRRLATAV